MKRRAFLATAAATTLDVAHGHATAEGTTYDYIVVGAGAGGGPLACRLAEAGKKVLLLDAGGDPAKARSMDYPDSSPGEVHDTPCYYPAASEDKEMSWQFSVRHYANTERQRCDHKYDARRDAAGAGGIFYPRSSGLGGCTGHHAMIIIRPNDRDWNHIAQLTGDDSWEASKMQPYFAKFERCQHVPLVRRVLGALAAPVAHVGRKLKHLIHPDTVDSKSGHGFRGWQPTSFIPLSVVLRIITSDKRLADVLDGARRVIMGESSALRANLIRVLQLTRGRFAQRMDPNDLRTRRKNQRGLFFIPTGMDSDDASDAEGRTPKAKRAGVREFILKTQQKHPDKLHVMQGVHVLRVLFAESRQGAPRATGVECMKGNHLYKASPLHHAAKESGAGAVVRYFTRGEVILCGGAFNTPQLLMLSGIGDRGVLQGVQGLRGITGVDGTPLRPSGAPGPRFIHLPGVGRNLQDRYEVSVISTMKCDFKTLSDAKASFLPGDPNDRARADYLDGKDSLYGTNGGTMAYMQRSGAAMDDAPEPDLFTFGVPAAFRGYYWRWSKELLQRCKRPNHEADEKAPPPQRNLWSWVILKAYTNNNAGTVRLRSADPYATPEICFHSFDEGGAREWERDLRALMEAIAKAREINKRAKQLNCELFDREVQPGTERPDSTDLDSPLAKWIKDEAWGHHACGTCRIGSDAWRANTAMLQDKGAVLDSKFRVHGVEGLRVADASVFPKIPGYFIVAPIFMISEKAADVILGGA